jgi:hypothetical protein
MDAPKILFIDAATTYGVAIGRAGERPQSWTDRFAEPGSSHGAISAGAMKFITAIINVHRPDEIVIEAPLAVELVRGRTNAFTTAILMGLPFAIKGMAYMHGYFKNITVATVKDIRHHFIGCNPRGDKGKKLVFRKCLDLGWINPDDKDRSDNRSDALAGWSYAETILAPRIANPVDDLFIAAERRKRGAAAREVAAIKAKALLAEPF